jgi:ribosomal protein L21
LKIRVSLRKIQNSGAAALLNKPSPEKKLLKMQIIQFDQILICDDGDTFVIIQSLFLKKMKEAKKVLKNYNNRKITTSKLRRQTMKKKLVDSTFL